MVSMLLTAEKYSSQPPVWCLPSVLNKRYFTWNTTATPTGTVDYCFPHTPMTHTLFPPVLMNQGTHPLAILPICVQAGCYTNTHPDAERKHHH
jgi:hypothetical protein